MERSCHKGVEVEIKRSKNKTTAVESAMRESRIKTLDKNIDKSKILILCFLSQ